MSHMTDEEYIANAGLRCPVCRGRDLSGGSVEIEGGIAWQPVTCHECNATWNDQYKLTGYDWLETAEENEQ